MATSKSVSDSFVDDAVSITRTRSLSLPPVEVRTRLEWTWGLEYGSLDQHLATYYDSDLFASNDTLLLPTLHDFHNLYHRHCSLHPDLRPPQIMEVYDGQTTFDYLPISILPFDRNAEIHPIQSKTPPHLVLVKTGAKFRAAGGYLFENDDLVRRIGRLIKKVAPGTTFGFGAIQATLMYSLLETWIRLDMVPATFPLGAAATTSEPVRTPLALPLAPARHHPPTRIRVRAKSAAGRIESTKFALHPEGVKPFGSSSSDDLWESESDCESSASGSLRSSSSLRGEVDEWLVKVVEAERGDKVPNSIVDKGTHESPVTLTSMDFDESDYMRVRLPGAK